VTLFHGSNGSGGDRYLAHVSLGDTVILLDDFDAVGPYSSRDGMLTVARANAVPGGRSTGSELNLFNSVVMSSCWWRRRAMLSADFELEMD
jgi:hypothetical protein